MIHVWPTTFRAAGWAPGLTTLLSRRFAAELTGRSVAAGAYPSARQVVPLRPFAELARPSRSRIDERTQPYGPLTRPRTRLSVMPNGFPPTRRWSGSSAGSPKRQEATLPEDYDPTEGVPFRAHNLSRSEVQRIFGPDMDPRLANRALRILHGRRLAGTVEDTSSFPDPTGYSQSFASSALAWLRSNYPVDEQRAYELRIAREQAQIQKHLVADAERLGIYKPERPKGLLDDPRYGKSGLDAIREEYRKDAERKYGAQAREIRDNTGTLQRANQRAELARRETSEWMKKYQERAMVTKDKVAPAQTIWRRLLPSAIVTSLVVLLSVYFAEHYHPPSRAARLWPDVPPAAATVLGIIIANSLLLVAWRIPMFWGFLNRYFLSVPGYPFALSMVGNMFSHQQPSHLAMNMTVLWIVGTKLHDDIGRGNFLALYFSSGVIASFVSLSSYVFRQFLVTSSLGASGAVAGVIAAYCCYNSDKHFSFVFLPRDWLPPLSAYTVLVPLILVEIFGITRGWGRLDHWAHLGGYAAGAVGATALKHRARERQRRAMEERKKRGWLERVVRGD